jgi:hypothetical protein
MSSAICGDCGRQHRAGGECPFCAPENAQHPSRFAAIRYAARAVPHVAPKRISIRDYHTLTDALETAWLAGYKVGKAGV